MESVYLQGSEDVKRAGFEMAAAADSMRQTHGWMQEALTAHAERIERALEDHARRIEAALEAKGAPNEDQD